RRTAYVVAALGLLDAVALLAAWTGFAELGPVGTFRLAFELVVLFALLVPIRSGSRAAVAAALVVHVAGAAVAMGTRAREGAPMPPAAIPPNAAIATMIARGLGRAPDGMTSPP